jgi:hypothetical protein
MVLCHIVLAALLSVSQKKPDQQVRKHVLKAVKELLKQHAPQEELTRLTTVLDCVEDRVEQHNRLQPSAPWADIKDIRRQVGGNPPKNRNLSNCPAVLQKLKSFFPNGR